MCLLHLDVWWRPWNCFHFSYVEHNKISQFCCFSWWYEEVRTNSWIKKKSEKNMHVNSRLIYICLNNLLCNLSKMCKLWNFSLTRLIQAWRPISILDFVIFIPTKLWKWLMNKLFLMILPKPAWITFDYQTQTFRNAVELMIDYSESCSIITQFV